MTMRARSGERSAAVHDKGKRKRGDDADGDEHPRSERDDESPELASDAVSVRSTEDRSSRVDPTRATTPVVAATATTRSTTTTRRVAPRAPDSRPDRVRGTDVTSARAEEVITMTADPADVRVSETRHRSHALIRRERKTDEIGPLLSEGERDTGRDSAENGQKGTAPGVTRGRTLPPRARYASAAAGTAKATNPLIATPRTTASIPSSPTRERMNARPSTLPAAYPKAAVL